MRRGRFAMIALACVAVVLGTASGAAATDPVTFGSGYVLDQANVLSPSAAQSAQSRLDALSSATGVDLYVAIVDTFTNPADRQQWADTVADANGLGRTQYLLAIAATSRQFTISALDDGPVSEPQLQAIEAQIRPKLRAGDFSGAITAAADGFDHAVRGGSGPGWAGWLVVLLIVAAVAAVVVWLVMRTRRRRRAPGAAAGPALETLPLAELARRASAALIQTDDAVRTSEQELGFAQAEFDDEATASFAAALTEAKAELDRAFALKQKLDDAIPDTDDDTRAWNAQIVQLCGHANQVLDEKAAAFDELRDLERHAPEALTRIQARHDGAQAGMDAAAAQLRRLTAQYAPEALTTVADNVDQARQRLAFTGEQLDVARQALAAGKAGRAAVALRAAEQGADQAVRLQQAIGTLETELADAARQTGAAIAQLDADAAAASALPDPDGRIAPVVTAARAQLETARAAVGAAAQNPLGTLQGLEGAAARLDDVLQDARDAAARAQRAQQQLAQTMVHAQAQASAAQDYLTARRGAIGAEARTRLAQAGAELERARELQAADPEQALVHARRADQLAGAAMTAAQSDVGGFAPTGIASGGNVVGAVLGGIIISSLLGAGRGGAGGMGGLGGGLGPGSFGGGGTRSRRGGGRF